MISNLRDLFAEDISDETAYHIGTFLHELAIAFESCYLGQIRRYHSKSWYLNREKQHIPRQNTGKNTDDDIANSDALIAETL